ncbi:MAG: flavodoxin domain-containing protein [Promethearchaeota archaeon]|nr:MAG: flavodoxin domain-containing protein [Candidatus Lokiarchaeota archaeon]
MLKAIIIYHTCSGNTKLLAEKIKERLESLNIEIKIFQDTNFQEIDSIKKFDIIGLGSPTHYYHIAKIFKEFLQKINNFNLRDKKLIAFATGSAKSSPPKICNDIVKVMKQTGIQTIAKIGCVKKPTKDINSEIEGCISKEIFKI